MTQQGTAMEKVGSPRMAQKVVREGFSFGLTPWKRATETVVERLMAS